VGYAGGKEDWPTYREIKDHTEAVRVVYNPAIVSYEAILRKFFDEHSPYMASWNRQYRSAILTNSASQKAIAQQLVVELSRSKKIYTSIEYSTDFYQAEGYHLKYIEKMNGKQGY
jgi:peptide-methionine (S)-S-oxide reductase